MVVKANFQSCRGKYATRMDISAKMDRFSTKRKNGIPILKKMTFYNTGSVENI